MRPDYGLLIRRPFLRPHRRLPVPENLRPRRFPYHRRAVPRDLWPRRFPHHRRAYPADLRKIRVQTDPFKPFMETVPTLQTKADMGKKKSAPSASISPLQRLELGQFRLLGIAGNENSRAAIVADGTTKKFYSLFVGTYIGLNGGRVAAILPDRVVVEERVEPPDKKTKRVQVRKIPILLHKEHEEGKP